MILPQTMGKAIRNATKIGTLLTLNHIRASSITDSTGVDLITVIIGVITARKPLKSPARTPIIIPDMYDIINPAIPRKKVEVSFNKKFLERIMDINDFKTNSGGGKIISA